MLSLQWYRCLNNESVTNGGWKMGILSGLKVLDFSTLLPGPFATMMLADMGAEVLKIEAPEREDLVKYEGPMDGEVSATFAHLNRSKRSLALDLKARSDRNRLPINKRIRYCRRTISTGCYG